MSEYNYLDDTKRSVALISVLSAIPALFITPLAYRAWEKSHNCIYLGIHPCIILCIPLFLLYVSFWYLLIDDVKSLKIREFGFVIRIIIAIIFTPIFIILSLLSLDVLAFFLNPTIHLYVTPEIQNIFFSIYKGAIVILALFVSCYVAYIRSIAIKQTDRTFESTQKQFNDTQIQNLNEEVEKRFQEGIKLLGNENESVRLGGIYILWEIIKEAVKGLPYIDNPELGKDKKANLTEISAYKKAHSLHVQILDILCAHIRTQTNSENYLKQYYPSIYRGRYPKQFEEAFGEGGKHNFLAPKDEKPSNEIQTLLNLLTKSKSNKKLDIPNYQLGFVLNFERAFLGGANCNKAHFEGANCIGAYFTHSNLHGAHFEKANCVSASFECAMLNNSYFNWADLREAHFEKANLYAVEFDKAICIKCNFSGAKLRETRFYGKSRQIK